MAIEKYYLKPVEESLEECLATYGDKFHRTLKEAVSHFFTHKSELGPCDIIKVTTEAVVIDTIYATGSIYK